MTEYLLVLILSTSHAKAPTLLPGFESKAACEREAKQIVATLNELQNYGDAKFKCIQVNRK